MEFSRVLWGCRRGMLELDLLLGPFAHEVYPSLSPAQQAHFEAFLTQDDQLLFDWFMNKKEPTLEFSDLVNEIRSHAKKAV